MPHSHHNTGVGNQKKHTEKYYKRNHDVRNKKRKSEKWQKFLEFCKRKWDGNRTPRGMKRRLRRKQKREGKTLQII
jgi:hypothetical protein